MFFLTFFTCICYIVFLNRLCYLFVKKKKNQKPYIDMEQKGIRLTSKDFNESVTK